jgi:hypothetical protein
VSEEGGDVRTVVYYESIKRELQIRCIIRVKREIQRVIEMGVGMMRDGEDGT